MSITSTPREKGGAPWLLFIFQLPQRKASARVRVWRKLQSYGALAWKNGAYILPQFPANLEKFQWLAAEVRKHNGEASIAEVARIAGTSDRQIVELFRQTRDRDYGALIDEIRSALRPSRGARNAKAARVWARLNRRLAEIIAFDVFGGAKRKEAEALLSELESHSRDTAHAEAAVRSVRAADYHGQTWMTRPRPEVDRVASAWLIKTFIDPKAKFVFSSDPAAHPGAARFDMFEGDFTHEGDQCTFEVLVRLFDLRDKRLRAIAQIVHDADFEDDKFRRPEGRAIDMTLKGWARMKWPDELILRRGMDLYEGLYHSMEG